MGQLPNARVQTPSKPFEFCGMDYFGPMEVTIGRRREKRYGVLFTCLSTRAIHLEIAPSLTTDSAINAIRRMIGRRGLPKQMNSDNGTNLRGADKELQKALDELDQCQILQELTPRGIEWHFIPPSAPHMGGSWERMVKSVKMSLRAVLKERAPKEDDLHTLFIEAENLVNSRPLTKFSDDPDDEECLTPNHFLIGSSGASQSPGHFTDRNLNFRDRWRYAQRLTDHFWKRWLTEYLPTLVKRSKWHGQVQAIKIGDIVLIVDSNIPRHIWPKGKIIDVHPGKDGQIRVVTIKTQAGILKRPVAKLCIIDNGILEDVVTPDPNIEGKNVGADNDLKK